jgi:hypothetical protein
VAVIFAVGIRLGVLGRAVAGAEAGAGESGEGC